MYSQQSMGLGTFLSKFSNLTNAIIDEKEWSIFDLDMEIKSDQSDKICSKMGKMDKFLSEYFKELGVSIGFNKNHTLSLFDLPSILSPALGGSQTNTKLTKVYHIKYHSLKDICLAIVLTLCQSGFQPSSIFVTHIKYTFLDPTCVRIHMAYAFLSKN